MERSRAARVGGLRGPVEIVVVIRVDLYREVVFTRFLKGRLSFMDAFDAAGAIDVT